MVHKSQSVVSRQILSMETELGFPLFNRDSRFCTLTPGGQHFADGLRELVKSYETLVSNAQLISSGVTGTLTIGMHGGEVSGQYSKMLNNFCELYPNIAVTIVEYRLSELKERLRSNELDLAFVVADGPWYSGAKESFKFIISGIRWDCLYIHKSHPLFQVENDKLHLTDFQNDTFVVFTGFEPDPQKGPTSKVLEGIGMHPKLEGCDNLNSSIMRLETGKRVMISSNHLLITNSSDFRKLYFPELSTREEAVTWHVENDNPCINVFANFLRKFIAKNPSILTYDIYYP